MAEHNEWIQLLEISGPFLSDNVLKETFPQGLDKLDTATVKQGLRQAYDDWLYNKDQKTHTLWTRYVLEKLLQYEMEEDSFLDGEDIPETLIVQSVSFSQPIKPTYALLNPEDHPTFEANKPRLLINVYPRQQKLNRTCMETGTALTPQEIMTEMCRMTGIPLGLVSNGEEWIFVHAPVGETSTYVSWQASLWIDEPVTFKAFLNLLSFRRFFAVAEPKTLEKLFHNSLNDQFELTDQLGKQVRDAVEILVHTFDKLDRSAQQQILDDVDPKVIYEGALTIMMRLVLIFCAEERGLFPENNEFYLNNYALSNMISRLQEDADKKGRDVLMYHYDAWAQLIATFRMVYAGVDHDLLHFPAYGSSLFDPDRFPFLEGRMPDTCWKDSEAEPLAVDNRTVLFLLEALQVLNIRGETRRISFRALDPEQIGYIYEGLLDHTAVRANDIVLGLKGKKKGNQDMDPEIPLSELEEELQKGEESFFKYLKKPTGGKNAKQLGNDLHRELKDKELEKLKLVCHSEGVFKRVKQFAGLLRLDTFEMPFVIHAGGVYVTEDEGRGSSGTHYTPRFLCEEVVKHTLEPLVFIGPSEGKDEKNWTLKSAEEILDLKICDIAMGSGAFLVQACRYMSEKLVEAWNRSPEDINNTFKDELSIDPDERLMFARRLVTTRCLYGVDKNPMAVQMAKLSLWLLNLNKVQPFTFLDHHLRCGDSLLGIADIEQLKAFHMHPNKQKETSSWLHYLQKRIAKTIDYTLEKRQEIEKIPDRTVEDSYQKELVMKELQDKTSKIRILADLLVGAALQTAGKKGKALDDILDEVALQVEDITRNELDEEELSKGWVKLADFALSMLGKEPQSGETRQPFHWVVEFPEVFMSSFHARIGFDGIIGNPPFLGGKKITFPYGTDYRDYLVKHIASDNRGSADLCTYFVLKTSSLLQSKGYSGLIATNTISQGDTREVGLDFLMTKGVSIYRAISSQKWPGIANLEISIIWISNTKWQGYSYLSSQKVEYITPYLSRPGKIVGTPHRLVSNNDKAFLGSCLIGIGFVLTNDEVESLLEKSTKNKDVIFPYLNGKDLNNVPDHTPTRWTINFFDWPLNKETAPKNYNGSVAEDYPDCLNIVIDKVKPDRTRLKENGEFRLRKPLPQKWWIYGDKRPKLYSTISKMERVMVLSLVNNHLGFSFVQNSMVYSNKLAVFALDDYNSFSFLQSSFHYHWAWKYSSTMRKDINYSPTDVFLTFPVPLNDISERVSMVGKAYYTYRQQLMLTNQEGLTKTYNRFHNPDESSESIQKLREFHIEMDYAVAKAYGWDDIELNHDFHETKQGLRFTISEEARQEILDRLLELNHQRYAEEVEQGLHDKKKKKSVKAKQKQMSIFGQMG